MSENDRNNQSKLKETKRTVRRMTIEQLIDFDAEVEMRKKLPPTDAFIRGVLLYWLKYVNDINNPRLDEIIEKLYQESKARMKSATNCAEDEDKSLEDWYNFEVENLKICRDNYELYLKNKENYMEEAYDMFSKYDGDWFKSVELLQSSEWPRATVPSSLLMLALKELCRKEPEKTFYRT